MTSPKSTSPAMTPLESLPKGPITKSLPPGGVPASLQPLAPVAGFMGAELASSPQASPRLDKGKAKQIQTQDVFDGKSTTPGRVPSPLIMPAPAAQGADAAAKEPKPGLSSPLAPSLPASQTSASAAEGSRQRAHSDDAAASTHSELACHFTPQQIALARSAMPISLMLLGARLCCGLVALHAGMGVASFVAGNLLVPLQLGLHVSGLGAFAVAVAAALGAAYLLLYNAYAVGNSAQLLWAALFAETELVKAPEEGINLLAYMSDMNYPALRPPFRRENGHDKAVFGLVALSWTTSVAALWLVHPLLGATWAQLGCHLGAQAVLPEVVIDAQYDRFEAENRPQQQQQQALVEEDDESHSTSN